MGFHFLHPLMRTLFLFSAGALLLTGCDFAGGSDAASFSVASVQATDISFPADEDGTAPDVFFEIQDGTGRSYYRSDVQNNADVTMGARATIVSAISIPSATMPLQIAVYDFDTSLSDSDLVAQSKSFTAAEVADESATTLAAERGSATFTVVRGN